VLPLTEPLVGRQDEIAALGAALGRVRSGSPQLVLVQGPPGIGKTTLLDRFVNQERDVHSLRATGEQWEAFVAFGVIDQVMRGPSAGRMDRIHSQERSSGTQEPVNVGAKLLEFWGDLDTTQPVITIVDDAQ
jgi:hypothetical protein